MTPSFLKCDELLQAELAVPHGKCGPPPRISYVFVVKGERYRHVHASKGWGDNVVVSHTAQKRLHFTVGVAQVG